MNMLDLAEKREYEQFFFSEESLAGLVRVASDFRYPCLLCAPTLGVALESMGRRCRTLDIDVRFSGLGGFKFFDLNHPISFGEEYDLVLCDPPFGFDVQQVFEAVDILRGGATVVVSWYQSRLAQFLRVFSDVKPVGVTLTYRDKDIPFYDGYDVSKYGRVVVELYSSDPGRVSGLWG